MATAASTRQGFGAIPPSASRASTIRPSSSRSPTAAEVIAKANDQGLDTTKLQEDVEILNEKVQLYAVQAALLNSKLAEATDVDCDSDEGPDQLQVILQEARTQLKAVREASKDVHRFIRETVISDLRELKSQIVDTSNEEESTESE